MPTLRPGRAALIAVVLAPLVASCGSTAVTRPRDTGLVARLASAVVAVESAKSPLRTWSGLLTAPAHATGAESGR